MSVPAGEPPGRAALQRRVADHPTSLARMRARLAAEDNPASVRALSQHDSDDPAVALLDAWATVADAVSFYTARIANEGYLRTAAERASLRELARTLGHELRPGAAAQVALAFTVEDAAGAPGAAVVPRATPVQTVPGPGQMPQVFETSTSLNARAGWNAIPGAAGTPQPCPPDACGDLWVAGTTLGLRAGDAVVVDTGPTGGRVVRTVTEVVEDAGGHGGWTRLVLTARPGGGSLPATPAADAGPGPLSLHVFATRAYLFGWNAPDPALLSRPDGSLPAGADAHGWQDFGLLHDGTVEIDGDHPDVLPGSVLAIEGPVSPTGAPGTADTAAAVCLAEGVLPGAASRYGVSGRLTRVTPDRTDLPELDRRGAVVLCGSRSWSATLMPRAAPVTGPEVVLAGTADPALVGRLVVVSGYPHGTTPPAPGTPQAASPPPQAESTRVRECGPGPVPGTTRLVVDPELTRIYDPRGLHVHANVVLATHGETVTQVLGGGDDRSGYRSFPLRRGPLTHLRATTPTGIRSSLEVRVDGVAWTEVESLADVHGEDHVFAVRERDDGIATITFGEGVHGARVPSGQENVTATYRVGIGPEGDVVPGQVSVVTRRPFGIRSVTNPAPSDDWARRESEEQVRGTAPVRVRTLDRVVSVEDHGDVARGFVGVQAATATAVWNGTRDVVTVSLLGTDAQDVSDELRADLRSALDAIRDSVAPLIVLPAGTLEFSVHVALATDPAYWRPDVEEEVVARLEAEFGQGRWGIASAVSAARVLVAVRSVPGVLAARRPQLTRGVRTSGEAALDVLEAHAARWDGTDVRAAEALVLGTGATTFEELR
ncbi:hypothetical protein [Actinomycetospora flava]|uniref:Baseplate assembly protein n=1 Tax=Actinomycetospora flava TaxID=3129232 RepID=A0ABU8M5F6_9PSEU